MFKPCQFLIYYNAKKFSLVIPVDGFVFYYQILVYERFTHSLGSKQDEMRFWYIEWKFIGVKPIHNIKQFTVQYSN